MKSRFTITISDIYGSKHYLLHQVIKKIVLYVVLLIILLIVFGSFFISFLMYEVDSAQSKKVIVENEYKKLQKSNLKLKKEIEAKTKEYDEIRDKVSGIEELIGLKPDNSLQLSTRVENIDLTSIQEQTIMNYIPNGYVLPDMRISAKFGWRRHPILKKREFHRGIDLKADRKTPVKAPADGVVEFAGYHKSSGFGYLIIIDHNFGFKTEYGHLYKKMIVKAGEFVKKGEIIGYTGNSGLSTGPHLHYEIRFISRPLNPINFLKWDKKNFKEIFKKEKRVPWESLISMISSQFPLQKQQ
ncbi:MAG: M23 family metallopeptidase [Sulfurospirillum sp.]